jgi:nucleotidyltransferase substrate binding protein (TIGR01987 family)
MDTTISNYVKAITLLKKAIDLPSHSEYEKESVIQRFEYTYELAWNTIKDYLQEIGYQDIYGPGNAIQTAFKIGIVTDGELWMEMKKSRNNTVHTYDETEANKIFSDVISRYYPLFEELRLTLDRIKNQSVG